MRKADDPRFIIQNWMRSRDVIDFLGIWECLHNPDFNRVKFEAVKNEAGYNRFVMTPTKLIRMKLCHSKWHEYRMFWTNHQIIMSRCENPELTS